MSAPPRSPGTYVLVFYAPTSASTRVGALGELHIRRGYYLYVGSAHGGGGLAARVTRHLRPDKPKRWHMDYLRPLLRPLEVWWQSSEQRLESRWVCQLSELGMTPTLPGFGASDSPHPSHLFYSRHRPRFAHWQTRSPASIRWHTLPPSAPVPAQPCTSSGTKAATCSKDSAL